MKLPWGSESLAGLSHNTPVGPDDIELGLFHVTGPYSLDSYVLAKSGQEAIMALTIGDQAPWSGRIFPDQCQAEYMGQKVIPKASWSYFLASIESPFGLVLQPSR